VNKCLLFKISTQLTGVTLVDAAVHKLTVSPLLVPQIVRTNLIDHKTIN